MEDQKTKLNLGFRSDCQDQPADLGRPKRGFTLVEMLIVLAIIAIAVGASLVSFRGVRAVARDSERKTELQEIRSALEVYRSDNGSYPLTADALVDDYIGALPQDPLAGNSYVYENIDNGTTYRICAHLEADESGTANCSPIDSCGENCNYEVTSP